MPPKQEAFVLSDVLVDPKVDVLAQITKVHAVSDVGTATDLLPTRSIEVQSTGRNDVATMPDRSHLVPGSTMANMQQLLQFLNNTVPVMEQEMASQTHMQPQAYRAAYGTEVAADPLLELHAFANSSSLDLNARLNKHQLQVTAVCWSPSGATLAVAFGSLDAPPWGLCPGLLAAWNLARQGDGWRRPDVIIDTSEALTALAYHPTAPGMLACGTVSGTVLLWDLASSEGADQQLARSERLCACRHQEAVRAVCWVTSPGDARRHGGLGAAKAQRLYTLSADGRLLVWSGLNLTAPLYGWELSWVAPGWRQALTVGGVAMSPVLPATQQEELSSLVVAAEGGHVVRCQVGNLNEAAAADFATAVTAAAGPGGQLQLRSAVKGQGYQGHAGQALAVAVSPHHRQLFLSGGGDGALHLHHLLRQEPLLLLAPSAAAVTCVAWSPSRPLVFAAGTADGHVHVYDLVTDQPLITPVLTLDAGSTNSSSSSSGGGGGNWSEGGAASTSSGAPAGVHALAFNSTAPGLLAAAAGDVVKTWRLPELLVSMQTGEDKLLRKLAEAEDVVMLLRRQALVR